MAIHLNPNLMPRLPNNPSGVPVRATTTLMSHRGAIIMKGDTGKLLDFQGEFAIVDFGHLPVFRVSPLHLEVTE